MGWAPSEDQLKANQVWNEIRRNTSSPKYKVQNGNGTLSCPAGTYPFDFEVYDRRERRCAGDPYKVSTDPNLVVYKVNNCDYATSSCGPAADGSFTKGEKIERNTGSQPGSGKEEEIEIYKKWWFWVILLLILGVLGLAAWVIWLYMVKK